MTIPIVALSVAFAIGALVTLTMNAHQPAQPCVPEPVPAVKPARQAFALTHPLACEHGYTINCADFALRGECKEACL